MNTNNCSEIIYNELKKNNYKELSFINKRELTCSLLKKYLSNTMDSFYGFNNICEKYDIHSLIKYLSDSNCIVPLIEFLISIIGDTQNFEIKWIVIPKSEEISIKYTNNYITTIKTDNNYSYVFNYLYDYYLNMFEIKSYTKQL